MLDLDDRLQLPRTLLTNEPLNTTVNSRVKHIILPINI